MIYAIIIVLLRNGNRLNTIRVILLPSITIKFILFGIFCFLIECLYRLPDWLFI